MHRTVEVRCKVCGYRLGSVSLDDDGRALFNYVIRNQPAVAFNQLHRRTPVDDEGAIDHEAEPASVYLDEAPATINTWHGRCHAGKPHTKKLSSAMLRSFHAEATRRQMVTKYNAP